MTVIIDGRDASDHSERIPAEPRALMSRDRTTAGGVAPSAPGLFSKLRHALRGRPAAGAITHGNARRQRRQDEAAVAMAEAGLDALTADQALAVIGMHLRARGDITPEALHRFANAMSRHADQLERGRG